MKKLLIVLFVVAAVGVFAQQNANQQKFALVIGNGNYTGISKLNNPVNDANDMETALKGLGFTVTKVVNGNLEQMETAVLNLRRQLGGARNSYGFFFYAGHGVQASGENYLIPINADNIRTETQLRDRAVSLQFILDSLSEAGNELNMIVLDACRNNPFSWARSGNRGLSVISHAPSGSIVMYATGANSTAEDGTGRNGLFTGHLLNNLKQPGLSVFDVFDRTMGDVKNATDGKQDPELSLRYSGATRAYLGSRPVANAPITPAPAPVQPTPTPQPAPAPVVQPVAPPVNPPAPQPNPATAKASYDSGTAYYFKKEYDLAIADLTQAIRLDPNYAGAYRYRGRAYYEKKDYDLAIADFTQAIKLTPNDGYTYNDRGKAYIGKKDYDLAIADLTQAIKLNPNDNNNYYYRGIAYYEGKKDYDRAIADFTDTIKRVSGNASAATQYRANAYYDKKDYDHAIADFTQLIKFVPNSYYAYNRRGDAYQAKGDKAKADADYAKAKQLGYKP
jgi:Flp pilus assembly protein TadD